jgi:putative Flp pilus-assembly TadE/G-like protein
MTSRSAAQRFTNSRHDARRGYVLVLVAMLLFGVLALAALVIDFGMVRLTQRQMQSAVDSAALEGLQLRDDPNTAATDRDHARRQAASDRVADIFSDRTDETGSTLVNGAGPNLVLSGGVGDPALAASQLLQIGNPPLYKPTRSDHTPGLELNLDNEVSGDMVAGTHTYPGGPAVENPDYTRNDFQASSAAESPSSPSFLVRMRRTNSHDPLASAAGESSTGPALPYLFGRGSTIYKDPNASYSPRQDGITVRATAIADAKPAMSVGNPVPPDSNNSFNGAWGAVPMAIQRSFWADGTTFPLNSPVALTANNGQLVANTSSGPVPVGQFTQQTCVGQPLEGTPPSPVWTDSPDKVAHYLPIYDAMDGTNYVIGFGVVDVQLSPLSITKKPGMVASENASAVLMAMPPSDTAAQAVSVSQLLPSDTSLKALLLFAPALVH